MNKGEHRGIVDAEQVAVIKRLMHISVVEMDVQGVLWEACTVII